MKKFIYKTILIALPAFIILVAVNYFGDAARIFEYGYEKKIAKIVHNGSYVTGISNYDERLFQKEFIKGLHMEVSQ